MKIDPLLHWLRKHPRAYKLRVTGLDGVLREVDLKGAQLPRVVETLRALKLDTVEGLNADGAVMRAITMDELGEDGVSDEDLQGEPAPMFPRTPLPQITASDAETQRYLLTATLIANAYAHGYEIAFERLAGMVDAAQERSAQVEAQREALHRLQIKQLEAQLKAANIQPATEDGLGNMMLQTFMQSAVAGGRAPVSVPNGHAPEEVDGDA